MCGIAGIVAWRSPLPTREGLVAMCDAMTHRGPDDSGYLLSEGVALGMRRLAIIDLSTGHQPIFNQDRTIGIVFNGEIYNYRELRAELEALGHRFSTSSDTEVIVHLYEQVGLDFAVRLNGMFALAIHDSRRRKVVLARDHLGIKPLYLGEDAGSLVFGSEIKVVLTAGRTRRELDIDALGQFLAWEYVPGTATLIKGIRRLAPGTLLEIDCDTGAKRTVEFWDPTRVSRTSDVEAKLTENEWAERLDATVGRAVRAQMVSDVPLGAFLSGGVDSSLVVAHMGDARTFSIGFDDPSYDEVRWSKRVAEHLGVHHTVEIIRPEVLTLFERLMHFMDDPIGDFSIFPTYLVSKLAREHVTVALSGDGGDELFGGYETYVAQERSRYFNRLPHFIRAGLIGPAARLLPPTAAKKGLVNKVKRFVEGALLPDSMGHARWRIFATDLLREQLFSPSARAAMPTPAAAHIIELARRGSAFDARDRALYVDVRSYLVDNCLVKTDRMSMACSLEVRVPLLDLEVAELAFRIPSHLKFAGGATKPLLKKVAAKHVPAECIYRAKQGFSIPMKNWLKNEFAGLMGHYLDPARLDAAGIFNSGTVRRLRDEHLRNIANHSHVLWSLLVFEHWRERWGVAA